MFEFRDGKVTRFENKPDARGLGQRLELSAEPAP